MKKTEQKVNNKPLRLIQNDPWLSSFEDIIVNRHEHALCKMKQLTGKKSLSSFANGFEYFGLHRTKMNWVLREWAPNATEIYLIGDLNNWKEEEKYKLSRIKDSENWEIVLPLNALKHLDLYKLKIYWNGNCGERIPAWCNYVVQDEKTKIFSAQVWAPTNPYKIINRNKKLTHNPLLIYECHVGMSQNKEGVGTYKEFQENILPRIVEDGYNCIQIMAIQEHPYYGSFGYHVSNFFAPSSRFGTPDELKELIDTAHGMGLTVIMDLIHSHAVKNEVEGLNNFAGDPNQYFYAGNRHEHPAWDSLCFDYGKDNVIHFLLSNCKYWLKEFDFDGFRFDGVTSMLYYNHGLGENFSNYSDYFNGQQDENAICYLMLSNILIHEVKPNAITIAEEVSGMPGLAATFEDGGLGFDYRLAMNIPDFWIKMIKEQSDENWKPSTLFWELTNRRIGEKNISYCESHDQALVGDKTILFRLIDADMYWHFKIGDENNQVNRGIALHKMIRLLTLSTLNGGYLNFMGNEFGHPEWIDFPREGNGWSYKYARRQWNLVDDKKLCYHYLGDFDKAMTKIVQQQKNFVETEIVEIWHNDDDQVLAFMRGDLFFVFNFNPTKSFVDYGFMVSEGDYKIILDSDNKEFGGFSANDNSMIHKTIFDKLLENEKKGWLKLYLPARSAIVLRNENK